MRVTKKVCFSTRCEACSKSTLQDLLSAKSENGSDRGFNANPSAFFIDDKGFNARNCKSHPRNHLSLE